MTNLKELNKEEAKLIEGGNITQDVMFFVGFAGGIVTRLMERPPMMLTLI